MSADNYIAIQKRDGKYYVWMDFASNDNPSPRDRYNHNFETKVEADAFAQGWEHGEYIVEYGIQEFPDYETRVNSYAEEQINSAADQIRKNIENCKIYGISINRNNVNHLIVAAYHSGLMVKPEKSLYDYDLEARLALAIGK